MGIRLLAYANICCSALIRFVFKKLTLRGDKLYLFLHYFKLASGCVRHAFWKSFIESTVEKILRQLVFEQNTQTECSTGCFVNSVCPGECPSGTLHGAICLFQGLSTSHISLFLFGIRMKALRLLSDGNWDETTADAGLCGLCSSFMS